MIALDWGFLVLIGFLLRPWLFWHFLENSAINLVLRSNTVCWVNQVFLTISAISAAVLLGICSILNQPVAVSIIVRHHILIYCFLCIGIMYSPMRYTHSMPQGLVSACLGGSLSYFWLFVLDLWHVGHFLHTLWTVVWRPFQSKYWRRVCSVWVYPGWQSISWYQCTVFFCSAVGRYFFYFGIFNNGFGCSQERCKGYSLYARLIFVVV